MDKGVTNGVGDNKFDPGTDCPHVQILTMLWRAADKPGLENMTFSGDDGLADYTAAVNWARVSKIIDDSFEASAPCTRAQAVSYIWQAMGEEEAEAAVFDDVDAEADYAAAVAWAVKNGVTIGYANDDGTFSFLPDKVCSRGEIVTLLYRAYVPAARLTAEH